MKTIAERIDWDNPIELTTEIGQAEGFFGSRPIKVSKLSNVDEHGFNCDEITLCAHVHCTHSETIQHVSDRLAYPQVPLMQLCSYRSVHPDATACIQVAWEELTDNVTHWITFDCSVDPERDNGRLLNHRAFFSRHPAGVITELCRVPENLDPGLYALLTTIMYIRGSDAHPTTLTLFPLLKNNNH